MKLRPTLQANQIKKTVFIFCAFFSAIFSFSLGKSDENAQKSLDFQNIRVLSLNGPSSIAISHFFENPLQLEGANFDFELCASVNVELPKLLKGEAQIGFLPPNIAAKVFNANNGALVALGIAGCGNLSIITRDKNLHDLSGLKGKTVYISGRGATPDYIFRYILRENQINFSVDSSDSNVQKSDEVLFDFSIPTSELTAAIVSKKIDYALLVEPFASAATSKDENLVYAIDLQNEFSKIQSDFSSYPITLMVALKSFADENPKIVSKFCAAYEKAVQKTNENFLETARLAEKYTIPLSQDILAKAIPRSAYIWKNAKSSQPEIENLLSIFLSFAPDSIGGMLPKDNFYFDLN